MIWNGTKLRIRYLIKYNNNVIIKILNVVPKRNAYTESAEKEIGYFTLNVQNKRGPRLLTWLS